jgi:hypothetical protein
MLDKSFVLDYFPPQSRGVEIGVWKGEFSKTINSKISPAVLYLCDPWLFTPQHPDRWYGGTQATSQEDMDGIYNDVVGMFRSSPNVQVIRDLSTNLLSHIEPNSLDWTYIDGDHSYEAVLEDLNMSYQLVKSGGYITGDDFDNGNDIHRALDQFVNEHKDQIKSGLVQNRQFILKIEK